MGCRRQMHNACAAAALVVLLVATQAACELAHAPDHAGRLPGWHGERFQPSEVFAPDAEPDVRLELIAWSPRVFMLHNIITDAEIEHMLKLAAPRMRPSMVADSETGAMKLSTKRTSTGVFLKRGEDAVVSRVEARLARHAHLPASHGEPFEVLHYAPGQKNWAHYDAFTDDANVQFGGNRYATALLYLSDVEEGGETVFVEPGAKLNESDCAGSAALAVKPRRGAALLFYSMTPAGDIDLRSRHASCPVARGDKWSMTKWLRQEEFDPKASGDFYVAKALERLPLEQRAAAMAAAAAAETAAERAGTAAAAT